MPIHARISEQLDRSNAYHDNSFGKYPLFCRPGGFSEGFAIGLPQGNQGRCKVNVRDTVQGTRVQTSQGVVHRHVLRRPGVDRGNFSIDGDVPISSEGPVFQLPPDVNQIGYVHASRDTNIVDAGVDKLRREANVNGRVLGLDIEWEVSREGGPPNPPATIQLAVGNVVVIFHLLHGQRKAPDKLPQPLAGLLEDPSVVKTGVGIKGDCTRLKRFFGVDVRNVVDLAGLALERKVDIGPRRGLADLCHHLLGRCLQKEQHLRLSRWNVAELSEDQKG